MEIMKIFSDIEGDERLYSVLMSEDEVVLFSEIQKEFSSKSQKALRKVWDLQTGLTASGGKMMARGKDSATVGQIMDEIRGIGRRKSREMSSFAGLGTKRGVHESINNKARNLIGGNSVSGRILDSETATLGNIRGYKDVEKLTRKSKIGSQADYDHGNINSWDVKQIIKRSRGL